MAEIQSLTDIDPEIFAGFQPPTPGATIPVVPGPRPINSLQDIDPEIFGEIGGPGAVTPKGEGFNPVDALPGALGTALGGGAKWVLPGVPEPVPPKLDTVQMNKSIAEKALARKVEELQSAQRAHGINVDSIFAETQAAQARLADTRRALDEARAAVPGLPEVTPEMEAVRPLNEPKATGRGAGVINYATSVNPEITNLEAKQAGDYSKTWEKGRNAQALAEQTKGFLPGKNFLLPTPMVGEQRMAWEELQAAQVEAQRAQAEVAKAEAAHLEAQKSAAAIQQKYEKMKVTPPNPVNKAQTAVSNNREQILKLSDRIAELEAKAPGMIAKLGYGISKIPGIGLLAGGMTAHEIYQAVDLAKKKQYPEAAKAGIGGVGGALMFLPVPGAQVAGAAMMAAPLAYNAAQSAREAHAKMLKEAPPALRGLMMMP